MLKSSRSRFVNPRESASLRSRAVEEGPIPAFHRVVRWLACDLIMQLYEFVHTFPMAYNSAKRLKILRGLAPYKQICKVSTTQPNRFGQTCFTTPKD